MNEIEAKVKSKREEMVRTRAEIDRVKSSLLPIAELAEDIIPRIVRETGTRWIQRHGEDFMQVLAKRNTSGPGLFPWDLTGAIPSGAKCAGDPDGAVRFLTALVQAIVQASPAYEGGPRSSEYFAIMARLEHELAELGLEEEALVDKARAGGSVIRHRLDVQRRRQETEQTHGTIDADGRRRREAAINAQPRRSVSSYRQQ